MIVTHLLIVSMLVLTSRATSSSLAEEQARALKEEDRFSPQFVLDLLIGMIKNIVRDQILNILGITTTQATPILDALNGVPIIGALIPDPPTTTTTTQGPTSSTTPGAPGPVIGAIGGIIGLPGAIIGGVLPGQPTTTTTTTTTTPTTTTTERCGGLLGGGLFGC